MTLQVDEWQAKLEQRAVTGHQKLQRQPSLKTQPPVNTMGLEGDSSGDNAPPCATPCMPSSPVDPVSYPVSGEAAGGEASVSASDIQVEAQNGQGEDQEEE